MDADKVKTLKHRLQNTASSRGAGIGGLGKFGIHYGPIRSLFIGVYRRLSAVPFVLS